MIDNELSFKLKTVLLYGRAGSGKSKNAFRIAILHECDYILDDGLLIRVSDYKIITGITAKATEDYEVMAKIVLFEMPNHRSKMLKAIEEFQVKKLLIIAPGPITGEDIANNLSLPMFSEKINISNVVGITDTQNALNNRQKNKHILLGDKEQVVKLVELINQKLKGKYKILDYKEGCTELSYNSK